MDEFSIRCACGTEIHTSTAHLRRTIRCRCGRSVHIERPTAEPTAARRSTPRRTRSLKQRLQQAGAGTARGAATAWRALTTELFARRRPITRTAAWLQLAYLAGMMATWVALITLSERWLPATLLAYGPRAVVLLPLAIIAPLGLMAARRSLLFSALGAFVAVTQIMGFRIAATPGEPPFRAGDDRSPDLRIVTINTAGPRAQVASIDALIARHEPDVITLQECARELGELLSARPGWHVATHRQLCTLSRWPLGPADSMPRAEFTRVRQLGFGGAALAVRYEVAHPTRPFYVVNLHLETAFKGLAPLLGTEGLLPDNGGLPSVLPFSTGGDRVIANALIRDRESARAATWAITGTSALPVFVAGDFNVPVESTIYRRYWRGYTNAFEATGRGFGYTKTEGTLLRIRIDHVLAAGSHYRSTGAWLGTNVGSDHMPVIADFALRAR